MKRDAGPGGGQAGEQTLVDVLDEVVAELVEAVDGALGGDDGRVGGVGVASFVLLMPEIEVGPVLLEDELREIGGRRGRGQGGIVAMSVGCIMQAEDGGGGEHLVEG